MQLTLTPSRFKRSRVRPSHTLHIPPKGCCSFCCREIAIGLSVELTHAALVTLLEGFVLGRQRRRVGITHCARRKLSTAAAAKRTAANEGTVHLWQQVLIEVATGCRANPGHDVFRVRVHVLSNDSGISEGLGPAGDIIPGSVDVWPIVSDVLGNHFVSLKLLRREVGNARTRSVLLIALPNGLTGHSNGLGIGVNKPLRETSLCDGFCVCHYACPPTALSIVSMPFWGFAIFFTSFRPACRRTI